MNQGSFTRLTNLLGLAKSNRATQAKQRKNRQLLVEGLERRVVFDATYFALSGGNFSQDWSNAALITTNDTWTGVPSIMGYRGDGFTGLDPQLIITDTPTVGGIPVVDVNANQTAPNTFGTGGVTEFAITNPVVALAGSGTAKAPNLVIHLNTTGRTNVNVSYKLRDIDGSTDNSLQPVALQYRVGLSGNFTNVPLAFVADASSGPNLADLVTTVTATLPSAVDNQGQVQLRIITVDAAGSDEWIGIDDIAVTSDPAGATAPTASITPVSPDPRNTSVASVQIVFSEPVLNFDVSDLLLTRNGGPNLLTGSESLTSGDNTTFTLGGLSGLTSADGAYVLTLNVSNITDADTNPLSAGVVESWTMDASAPTVTALTPNDNSVGVFSEDNLVIVFNETVVKGTGNITVHLQSDNSVVATIDVTSTAVTAAGNTVTINPAANLPLSTPLYVNVPATAFTDSLLNPFAGISGSTNWNFTTTGISSIIAQQDFNSLTVQTTNLDVLLTNTQLTNAGSFNVGGPQLDFTSTWFDTRGNGSGPVLGDPDTSDFIGVNNFTGAFAPGVSANGTAVGTTEANFEINDVDGRVDVVFEPISLVGFSDRALSFNYWISATDFEAGDILRATISDGVNTSAFLDLDSVGMNANESLDNGTANWRTASVNLEDLIDNFGYGTTVTLTISVSNTDTTGADNVFIDNILVKGTADVLAPDIDVRGNSISIVNGDTTPSATDATSFGSVVQNGVAPTATFTIANIGNATLNLSGSPLVSLTGSPNFTVTSQPTGPVAAGGGTTTFVVTFTPTTLGLQTATISIASDDPDESPYTFVVSGTVAPPPPSIFINEIDSDTLGADAAEFIELYDGGVGGTSLNGLVLVLYNGSNDLSYSAFDLDGFTTDANGYFVVGNVGVPGVGVTFAGNFLQNGADAVAIYFGDAASFPNNTPVTLTNLIDAVVYGTNDADDTGLLTLVTAGGQVNEAATVGAVETNSIARVPNGGTLRNSSNFVDQTPTPGASNIIVVTPTITATPLTKVYDSLAFSIVATADDGPGGAAPDTTGFTYTYYAGPGKTGGIIPAPKNVNVGGYSVDVAYAGNASYNAVASTVFDFTITPFGLTGSITAADKVFDGNTSATILTRTLATVFPGDTVSYDGGTATFDTAAVGTGKTVTATGLTLIGADAGNYTVNSTATTTASITAAGSVVNRRVFYNGGAGGATGFGASTNFAATGGNPPATAIDSKVALLPGQNSGFNNYTNTSFGLNGIIVDIANPIGTLTAADFSFAKGGTLSQPGFVPFTPAELSTSILPVVTEFVGGGINGSTRAKITFNNNSLKNTWVKVTVLASGNSGLTADDVFYFGNVAGDVNGSITAGTRYTVNTLDTSAVRSPANQSTIANSVPVTNIYDFNKTGNVNSLDTSAVRGNQQTTGIVLVITGAPARGIAPPQAPAISAPAILAKSSTTETVPVFGSLSNETIVQTVVLPTVASSTDAAVKDLFAQVTTPVPTESSQTVGSIDDFFAQLGNA